MQRWYHDKRAGFIRPAGGGRYICRGFAPEHGKLLAAAPDLLDAGKEAIFVLEHLPLTWELSAALEGLKRAVAKADGLPAGRSYTQSAQRR